MMQNTQKQQYLSKDISKDISSMYSVLSPMQHIKKLSPKNEDSSLKEALMSSKRVFPIDVEAI